MNNLNDIQKFRANLAKELNYDITKAQNVCRFVFGEQTGCASDDSAKTSSDRPLDGIYFIQPDKIMVHESEATDAQKKSSIAVGVRMGEKFANVTLHDVADGEEIELCTDDCGTEPFFHASLEDVVADYDGIGNTKDIREYLNPQIKLQKGEYIPALGELYLLFINKKAVNKALEEAGGEPLVGGHWSSSENSSYDAWYLNFFNGGPWYYSKCGGSVVRPAVAV